MVPANSQEVGTPTFLRGVFPRGPFSDFCTFFEYLRTFSCGLIDFLHVFGVLAIFVDIIVF